MPQEKSSPPSPILLALAARYRRSKAGREGTNADFLADFRELLKSAACEDGEARVRADEDIRRACHQSNGMLALDLHPRDPAIIHRVRLRPAAESWLFSQLGQQAPAAARGELASFFRQHTAHPIPHAAWKPWLADLTEKAQAGKSILPFEREDPALNAELMQCICGILAWNTESLIRYASSVICGDSKRLETLEARLLPALRAITGDPETTLESFQILKTPRSVLIHGPLSLQFLGARLDFGLLRGPVAISALDIQDAMEIQCQSRNCLTVENEGVFRELAKHNPGILLVHTSFPGAATRCLLRRLPATMNFRHFGDSDPAGFDILRNLREASGRHFAPAAMGFRPNPSAPPLSPAERRTLERLLASDTLADLHPTLQAMLNAGNKGDFEQESIGPAAALGLLDQSWRGG